MTRALKDKVLVASLQKTSPEKLSLLSSFLAEPLALPTTLTTPLKDLSLKELFAKIDPSWYTPYIETLGEKEQNLLLSALGKKESYEFSTPLSLFFLNYLFHKIFKEKPLPLSYLIGDKLAPLALASKEELYKLFRFLALFDLAPELKKVLNAKTLQKMEELLTKEECAFLQQIQTQKNPVQFGAIGLNNWDGNIEKMQSALLDRGMNRLAKALNLSSLDLEWYIKHTLDLPTARRFTSFLSTTTDPRITIFLIEQVLTTWKKVCTPSL
ncbi:MAG: hypothetical protein JSR76_01785 [Verrucomicrobia bacterium]|nr:hypothetical protein [Verrucomicrobiota bacterium]